MIFDLVESIITGNKIAIPVNNPNQIDAWEMANMLANAFPWHRNIQFNFHVCCAGGFDNGIEFCADFDALQLPDGIHYRMSE